MRRVLGQMYDKYETFNMYLYQITQSSAFSSLAPSTNNQLVVNVRIKGLQFLYSTYNVKSCNNTNLAILSTYTLNNLARDGIGTITQISYPSILTFSKTAECVDLTIDMTTIRTQDYPAIVAPVNQGPPNSFGTFIYIFKIRGNPTRENNIILNGSRMRIN